MILLQKFLERDMDLMEKWKYTYEFEKDISAALVRITKDEKKKWVERIYSCDDCKYWIINNGGIKIGIININHINSESCTLEYYIGDAHFRDRNISPAILWNMYNYIFYKLGLKYVITNILENDEKDLETHLKMGCEIKGRFKEEEFTNEKFSDIFYVLMKSEKWNNIKDEFDFEEISIETI